MTLPTLLDERSETPLRTLIGQLMKTSSHADFAITNVRIGAIDLTLDELSPLESCRLLIERLDADMLAETAAVVGLGGRLSRNLRVLHDFSMSGCLQVRAAGSMRWMPDFSVLHAQSDLGGRAEGQIGVCLLGAHYFSRPVVTCGASLTCALSDPMAVRTAAARFEELWADGHDVLPVIQTLFRDLLHGD